MFGQNHTQGARWRYLALPLLLSIPVALFLLYLLANNIAACAPGHWPAQSYNQAALQRTDSISSHVGPVNPLCACKLAVENTSSPQTVPPGSAAHHQLKFINRGDCPGALALTAASQRGWEVQTIPSSPMDMPAGSTAAVTVVHVAPTCELSDAVDVATIRATLHCESPCGDSGEQTTTLTTIVEKASGVALTPDRSALAAAGETALFTHTLTNTGNYTAVFDFEAISTLGWSITVPAAISVEPCGSKTVSLSVAVPPAAERDQVDTVVMTAASTNVPNVTAHVTDQIQVSKSGCEVDLNVNETGQSVAPSKSVTYTLTVQNIGAYTCAVGIETDAPETWSPVVVSPATTTLPPGQAADWLLGLTAPPGEAPGEQTTGVTAILNCATIGQTSKSSRNIETTVIATSVAAIDPGVVKTVMVTRDTIEHGAEVSFTHTVANVGNLADTFNFDVHSARGWTIAIPPAGEWSVGESKPVSLRVAIPPGVPLVSDTLVVAVRPAQAPDYYDVAVDRLRDGRLFLPVVAQKLCGGMLLCNGDFEAGNLTCWNHGGELPAKVVPAPGSGYRALLGDPYIFGCRGGVPVGRAWLTQTLQTPSYGRSTLTFDYEVHTQHTRDFDSFEVYLAANGQEHLILRVGHTGARPGCDEEPVVITGACAIDLANPTDCNGQPLTGVDLTCVNITLRFENWNREHMWYNTWTYVDNVRVTQSPP